MKLCQRCGKELDRGDPSLCQKCDLHASVQFSPNTRANIVRIVAQQRCHRHTFTTIDKCGCMPDPSIFTQEACHAYADAKNISYHRRSAVA